MNIHPTFLRPMIQIGFEILLQFMHKLFHAPALLYGISGVPYVQSTESWAHELYQQAIVTAAEVPFFVELP